MTITMKALSTQLYGPHYKKAFQGILQSIILYLALSSAEIHLEIAPHMFYFMMTVFTAGMMWQTLRSAGDKDLDSLLMLPFSNTSFTAAYVISYSVYAILTKSMLLLAVLLAVCPWSPVQTVCAVTAMCTACPAAAACYTQKTRKTFPLALLLPAASLAAIFCLRTSGKLLAIYLLTFLLACVLLLRTNAYTFRNSTVTKDRPLHTTQKGKVSRYLFRYLTYHKNYLLNTAVLWTLAIFLPFFLRSFQGIRMMPIAFAILSLNTPICILLSCDPPLNQALHMLPKSPICFCIPYGVFIFSINLAADIIFACSWSLRNTPAVLPAILTALLFSLQSAVLSVILEWKHPLKNWKLESDLWHHPRKYLVPAILLLIAALPQKMPHIFLIYLITLTIPPLILLHKPRRF